MQHRGLPWRTGLHLPTQGTTGSLPGRARFHMQWSNSAHVPQLLSLQAVSNEPACRHYGSPHGPHTATTEARALESVRSSKRSQRKKKPATKSSSHSLQPEKAHAEQCYSTESPHPNRAFSSVQEPSFLGHFSPEPRPLLTFPGIH